MSDTPPIYMTYLNRLDIEALAIDDEELLLAIEQGLAAQGRGEAVIEPRVHLEPQVANGHFNVLRGALRAHRRNERPDAPCTAGGQSAYDRRNPLLPA